MSDFNLDEFKNMVFEHLDSKKVKVFIFGSRATGTNRMYSDIDLGLQSESEIPFMKKINLEDEFENSNLPYKVDVVDFSKVAEGFKKVAMQKVIYLN